MKHLFVAAAVAALSLNAQAETFSTTFGSAGSTAQTLSAAARGSFTSGSFVNGLSGTDASIVETPDAVVRLNNTAYLLLGFDLLAAANQITVSFYASSSNTNSAGNALVSIDGGSVYSQAITAKSVVNPGPTTGATLISHTFAGSFLAGAHNLKIDNSTAGFRVDDVSVTAVPEPATLGMLLAGLGVIGFVGSRRRAG